MINRPEGSTMATRPRLLRVQLSYSPISTKSAGKTQPRGLPYVILERDVRIDNLPACATTFSVMPL
jgi:hypothetical protein